jgi:hypothetical protein
MNRRNELLGYADHCRRLASRFFGSGIDQTLLETARIWEMAARLEQTEVTNAAAPGAEQAAPLSANEKGAAHARPPKPR